MTVHPGPPLCGPTPRSHCRRRRSRSRRRRRRGPPDRRHGRDPRRERSRSAGRRPGEDATPAARGPRRKRVRRAPRARAGEHVVPLSGIRRLAELLRELVRLAPHHHGVDRGVELGHPVVARWARPIEPCDVTVRPRDVAVGASSDVDDDASRLRHGSLTLTSWGDRRTERIHRRP